MGILYEIVNRTKAERDEAEHAPHRPGMADLLRQSYCRADLKLKENLMHADKVLNKA